VPDDRPGVMDAFHSLFFVRLICLVISYEQSLV
jgi:hypothetical protein